ncbi:MAG: DUF4258 domain-containing protein [Methanolobus sp.]|nr:DUF4258 domain-containing protein [Methanolobus sp.]
MEILDLERIKDMIRQEQFIMSSPARSRMFQRNISTDEMIDIVMNSQIIESYPDDLPCPSVLLLGFTSSQAYHIVAAQCEDHVRIVTAYFPAKDKWIEDRIRIDRQ